ncbi:MAG: hypothetical protein Q9202_002076 [Teloschistes flavicans]
MSIPLQDFRGDRDAVTTIELPEISPPMLRRLIRYFYVLDYDDVPGQDFAPGYPAIKLNGRMLSVAVRFGVYGLQKIAASKFEDSCIRLASPCEEPLSALKLLADVATMIYSPSVQTYNELRSSIAKAVGSHLINDLRLLDNPAIKELCRQHPSFVYDLMTEGIKVASDKV